MKLSKSSIVLTVMILSALLTVSTPFAFAADVVYNAELVIQDGKKTKETDADITFKETSFEVVPDKSSFKSSAKTFEYKDIKVADYSYSKKPMLSGGGAVATALLVGFIFAIPFLFIKKKNHWLSIQTENDFAVMKLGGDNYRRILAEFATRGVKVATVDEEKKKKDDKD